MFPGSALGGIQPSEAALASVEKLRPRRMGVDRQGNLWYWHAGLGTVALISPTGARVAQARIDEARAVAADEAWGVVALLKDGRELQWQPWKGGAGRLLRLSGPRTDLCWIDSKTVAVSPQTSGDRIEIWDLQKGALVRTVGMEQALHPGAGATRMRTVLLQFEPRRKLLYSLESFTGDLQVFRLDGTLAWRASVFNPDRKVTEDWLRGVDEEAKVRQDVQTPTIYHFFITLRENGNVWTIAKGDPAAKEVTLIEISPGGTTSRLLKDVSCPSRKLIGWGDWLLFYGSPAVGQEPCLSQRRLP